MSTTVIFFSMDRPLQLEAALASYLRHCVDKNGAKIRVLFRASHSRSLSLYRRLIRDYQQVDFVNESNFRRDLLILLEQQDYIGFVVDDTVFVRDFSISQITAALEAQPKAIGFSMRLGRNTDYCYAMDKPQRIPAFQPHSGFLQFEWPAEELDFAYPLEVSSSIFRASEIVSLFHSLTFKNPNTLEEAMFQSVGNYKASHPILLCAEQSQAFAVPINKVQQEVQTNRAGTNEEFSAAALLEAFKRGERIDLTALDNFTPRGCHQEVEFKLVKSAAPVPLVSVVIPCFKQANYLPDAVGSVAKQTFTDWEIVIVDDGSPDDTAEIASKLSDPRIRLIRQINSGLAEARNSGVKAAQGAYVLPLDADDKLASTYLEKAVAILENQNQIAIVYTNVQQFGAKKDMLEAADFDFEKIKQGNQLNYCSMYRWEVWRAVGGYNPNMIWGFEDWDFWIRCGEIGFKPVRIPEALLEYRIKDESMYTHAMSHEAELRARIVLNHPSLYNAETLSAARAIWVNPKLPSPPNAPKVSVIVPTYNRPGRLEETLASIIAQTFQDFEIIVVNDNGTDAAYVVKHWEDKARIRYIAHEKNRGLAAARNTALHRAQGSYIAYLDDDDIFLPDHLETLVNFLDANKGKAAYTDAYCAREENQNGKYRILNRDIPFSEEWSNEAILVKNLAPVLCFMHDRWTGIAAGDFDESLGTHEDWEYWIRLSRIAPPVHIKKITCEFRLRTDGSSMTSNRRADFLSTAKWIYNKYRNQVTENSTRVEQKKFLQGLESELSGEKRTVGGFWKRLFGRAGS